MWITDFDEIWHKSSSFQKNIWLEFLFIGNRGCWRGESYPQGWRYETYFVKYLRNYWKYRFCVEIDEISVFKDEFNGMYHFAKEIIIIIKV